MCVILICDKRRPSEEEIEAAYEANPAGAGVAWRDKGIVHWKKGLNLEEIKEFIPSVPLPLVAHFRIPTAGGSSGRLTHPFPLEPEVPLDLEGQTENGVLFHNGHWGEWQRRCWEMAALSGRKFPVNKWSDSRAMAWIAANWGIGFLDLIDEKVVVLAPEKVHIFGKNWTLYGEPGQTLWCSNTGWTSRIRKNVPTSYHTTPPASIAPVESGKVLNLVPPVRQPGRSVAQETPFVVAERKLKQNQPISLEEVEEMYKRKELTRNQYNRLKKLIDRQLQLEASRRWAEEKAKTSGMSIN